MEREWLLADKDKTFIYQLGPNGTNRWWAHLQAAGPERADGNELVKVAAKMRAAPDLYRALADLVRDLEDPLDPATTKYFVSEAEKVLAKARGEQ